MGNVLQEESGLCCFNLGGLAYQIDNMDSKKQDKMFYPRFMKIIIHHFLKKDKSVSMRNRTFMHTACDDSLLGTMRFVSRHEDTQVYGAILPEAMTNQALLDSVAYKTYYAIASGAEPPKSRKSQKKLDSAISSEESPSKKKSVIAKKVVATKLKLTKKKETIKTLGTDEGTGTKPGVPDVPKYDSNSDKETWGDSKEEDNDDEDDTEDDEGNDDDNDDNSDNDGDDDDDNDANDDDNQ
ncbi:retrovirus-related pol polyprotein from transposon TNT 1-94 [Tanacetum coccineum]